MVDRDDTNKLEQWFEERWDDRFCLDISEQLAEIIDESWAGRSLKPYFVYLKMAYHLSQEARDGLSQYRAPASFGLLPFQEAAVQVAAKKLNSRGGVVISDVVGLGKTLGNKRSAAARTYDRLMAYTQQVRESTPLLAMGTEWETLERVIEEINQHPMKQNAIARLNREFKSGISDEQLAKLVTFLREHDALCVINPEERRDGAQIICSMGLFRG